MKRQTLRAIVCYLRNCPLEIARWRLELWAIRLCRECGASLGERIAHTKYGFMMRLNLADWVDQHIFATGDYEPEVIRVVKTLLNQGATAIDIGANIGFFSLFFKLLVGDAGKVISFEPAPSTRARLLENLAINGCEVTVHDEALSDESGEVRFYCGPACHSGMASLRSRSDINDQVSVKAMPLDRLMDEFQSVDLIKIDVEGAEIKVIDGMRRVIDMWHPDLIVEVSDGYLREMGGSATRLCELLKSFGYSMYQINSDNLEHLESWHKDLPTQFNALFTVRSSLSTTLNVRR